MQQIDLQKLTNTHDLDIGDWGPYSKKYAGISHVANSEFGIRFDLSVFPSVYRRKTDLPQCIFESNYHTWESASDLSYFSTRHELVWKDEVYCDISYAKLEENAYSIRASLQNNTDNMQSLALQYMASLQYPTLDAKKTGGVITPIHYNLPQKSTLLHAIDFDEFAHEIVRPRDSLVGDALRRGEVRAVGFYKGSAVLLGEQVGDVLHYSITNLHNYKNPVLTIRALNDTKDEVKLTISGDLNGELSVQNSHDIALHTTPISVNGSGDVLHFEVVASDLVYLDCFIITEQDEQNAITITDKGMQTKPLVWEAGSDTPFDFSYNMLVLDPAHKNSTLIVKYPDSEYYYGVYWDYADYEIRHFLSDRLDIFLGIKAHEHTEKVLNDGGDETYTNVFCRPISLAPQESKDIFGYVCCGMSYDEVQEKLSEITGKSYLLKENDEDKHQNICLANPTKNGEEYLFSQNMMRATTVTNIVYPIYAKQNYIKHSTPGKWWDTLYTWDSGFTGLGLSACDTKRAIENLNAYLTEEGDTEVAFVHHGTPIPVQFYLYNEIFQNTQSLEFLEYFYPKLKQYYLFMVGKLGSSDTARFNSGLLCTWSYFYNSGGWDDYPPQKYTHAKGIKQDVCCVSTAAHMIRCAKILKQASTILGKFEADRAMFDSDIKALESAIQTHTWDEESGYFGYLCHDDNANPTHILRTEDGENFNKGLDGLTPFVAGIVTKEQEKATITHLTSEDELSTPIGITTVDQSAGYYLKDGYWNGAVWMPHQWFFYKALLDYGYSDIAYSVAKRALDIWEKETKTSYSCFEHFLVYTKRGAGWHHFSGLSTPVLLWHKIYFSAGSVTCGLGGTIVNKSHSSDFTSLECDINFIDTRESTSIIITMSEEHDYSVAVNGELVDYQKRMGGVLELNLSVKENETIHISVGEAG